MPPPDGVCEQAAAYEIADSKAAVIYSGTSLIAGSIAGLASGDLGWQLTPINGC